jgi:3-hydroxyacyl-CoA dehydrogenase
MTSLVRPSAGESGFREEIRTKPHRYDIRRVGVLGAGTMGARIAAHVANAGIPVLLLDLTAAAPNRNAVATQALERLKKAKPAAFADAGAARLITPGNFDDDLGKLRECDWIVEAVAENLEIKRDLLAKVTPHIKHDTILTTNTSGLPVSKIGEQLPDHLRSRWLGTHFFNPPRYMRLLELIPTADTDPVVIETISHFADLKLGKTIVRANDTPNFIANRIGVFAMLNTFRVMKAQRLSTEEIDLLTGSVIGWPKTGTFRLADMVGIDVIYNVARNFAAGGEDERSDLALPPEIAVLMDRKWLGDKTQQGFYKKVREKDGSETRLVFNAEQMDYRPAARAVFPMLEMLKSNETPAERIRALMSGNEKDRAVAFYRAVLPELWIYAANRIGEVSRTLVEIDRAMKAGFNWELGPFEMWDAAGVPETVEIMRGSGFSMHPSVERLIAAGGRSWYRDGGNEFFDPESGAYQRIEHKPELLSVSHFEKSNGRVAGNFGISLIDVGDGIGCFEFHSKMNTIGRDIVTFLARELGDGSTAMASFDAFIITSDAASFSAGANLMQLLLAIQEEEWDEIDLMVRSFQAMTKAIKFCSRPVIVAPFGLCLGGGTEISLHGAGRQAHLELYAGLIETSVGLVPAGGGCKEMLLRAIAAAHQIKSDARADSGELYGTIKAAFETIAMAKLSGSAFEAMSLRLLDLADGISINRDRLLFDAKTKALDMIRTGYSAPAPKRDIPAPGSSVLATLKLGVYLMREGEFISEHDVKVANHVARILAGGEVSAGTQVTEDYLLDLEREAFLSLCGEQKTVERIGYTLKTGKPLRN